jgi:chromate transporter
MSVLLTLSDWTALALHFLTLSLLSVGGAISTVPDMHRFLVTEQAWLSEAQFTTSIALAQAAPGPNVLFVALIGWNVGLNAGGGLAGGLAAWPTALGGVALAMLGILLPSTLLTYFVARWAHQRRELLPVRAFKLGMAPIVVALLIATGWILAGSQAPTAAHWPLWLLSAVAAGIVWRTRVSLLWLLAAGALLGWLGVV